jgi:hypothetical protein
MRTNVVHINFQPILNFYGQGGDHSHIFRKLRGNKYIGPTLKLRATNYKTCVCDKAQVIY